VSVALIVSCSLVSSSLKSTNYEASRNAILSFFRRGSKHSLQQTFLKHRQSIFFLQHENRAIQNYRQNYSSIYFNLRITQVADGKINEVKGKGKGKGKAIFVTGREGP
jgi:hypothetical protein